MGIAGVHTCVIYLPLCDFILLPGPPTRSQLEDALDFTGATDDWFESAQVAIRRSCDWEGQLSPRLTSTATRPSDEPGEHLVSAPVANMHRVTANPSDDIWPFIAPFAYFAAGAFSLAILQIMLGPDAPLTMDAGTGPYVLTISANAGIGAPRIATSIERHSVADSEIKRVTNGTGPRRRYPRWPENLTLSARRLGATTMSLPSFSDIDPESPPPSPTMSLPLFDDSDTDSVIADFDFDQQASSSSLLLVNESSLGEQDFYAEFGAVVDDCESPSSNYMYLADDTLS
ncbi:hypothetical protein GGI17_003524 [Coemansia sp. S146]|nr:hypothetical protein GGI17_003524 [Coemansia sp. S146]